MARSVLQQLRSAFRGRARRSGLQHARNGLVSVEDVETGRVVAWVDDPGRPEPCRVEVEVAADEWRSNCSCPDFQRGPCAHLWASLIVATSEFGALFEPGRGGRETEEAERRARAPGLPSAEDLAALGVSTLTSAASSASSRREPEWRRRLHALGRSRLPVADRWPAVGSQDWDLRYLLVLAPGELPLVDWEERKLMKNGEWGVWKKPPLRESAFRERLSAADLQLIEHLARADDPHFYSPARLLGPFGLGGESSRLLPDLGRTGRLHVRWLDDERTWSASSGHTFGPLAWEQDPPWRLVVAIERDASSKEIVVEPRLARGDESVPSTEAIALIGEVAVFRDHLAPMEAHHAFGLCSLQSEGGPLRAAAGDEAELLEELAWHVGDAEIACSDESLVVVARPRPNLEVRRNPDGLDCFLGFRYGSAPLVEVGEPRRFVFDGERQCLLVRDPAAEREALERFMAHGGLHSSADAARGRDGTVSPKALSSLVENLLREGWTVKAEGLRYLNVSSRKWRVSTEVDWLDLEGEIEFEGRVVPLPQLIALAKEGNGLVDLGDGERGLLPEEWLRRVALLAGLGERKDGGLRFQSSQAALLDALLAAEDDVETDQRFDELRERLTRFRGVAPSTEPAGFQGELRHYQREGLGWLEYLCEQGLGGCLADDMGLGKTVQVLALLLARTGDRTEPLPSLVVAPRSLTFNWLAEARRFAPSLRLLDYTGPGRGERAGEIASSDLVVTTYGTLRRDVKQLREIQFDHVVLDEAQVIKNASSQGAKAVRLLKGRHRLALTGTPMENHLGELWSLLDFLNPGMLGRSRALARLNSLRREWSLDDAGRDLLTTALKPFLLRRTKQQVLTELPEKTEQVLPCELTGRQRRDYERAVQHFRSKLLEGGDIGWSQRGMEVLAALLRLRQIACHPGLLDPKRRGEESSKLEALLPMLRELVEEGHAALVFSQFTSLLAIVRKRLDEEGLRHEYLDGSTKDREEVVRRFQSEEGPPLFLVSLKAGGLGLNLTRADHVFVLDPWWNPAAESQAIDRAHRLGQVRPVSVHRLIARGTIEERVLELQERKRELASAVLGAAGTSLRDLTRGDLEALLC